MSGRVVRAYMALGDSFTAGRDSIDAERWADLLAAGMRRVNPELRYENLAVDGATSAEVLDRQVEPALALAPDFVTVICGANDVLLATRPDVGTYAKNFDLILRRLRAGAPEAMLVTATAPEGWQFMDLRPRTEARLIEATKELNDVTREAAGRYDVLCLPVAGHPALRDPGTFSADGLHPSSAGHELVARESASYMGQKLGIEFDMERDGQS
ncbi:MAG TPA: SGNH/GDSL hydrolase family protein [Solirubrobacterales bacterium]|nr:SGNH/GDSL hydrolase family protein [Solirubrobacterales bacterium]